MKMITMIATSLFAMSAFAASNDELDRRLQKIEQAIAKIEARLSKLEEKAASSQGGGMMGRGGMMGGGMMGGGKPNEQWRSPEAK